MPKITSYLGIGSNVGERSLNIASAIHYLDKNPRVHVKKISHLYETEPCGGPKNQPNYLNAAAKIETSLNPFDLLFFLKSIEKKLKRHTAQHWGPRTIDLDILFYGDLVLLHKDLSIPHSLLAKRRFVLQPLSEIAASIRHPLYKMTVRRMLKNLDKRMRESVAVRN